MARLPIKPTAVWGVVKEIKAATEDFRPILVAGAPDDARRLREELVREGDEHAVRDLSGRDVTRYDLDGARVLVYVIDGSRTSAEDEEVLRRANRKDVEVVCVLVGEPPDVAVDVPHVLATDVVSVRPGEDPPPCPAAMATG